MRAHVSLFRPKRVPITLLPCRRYTISRCLTTQAGPITPEGDMLSGKTHFGYKTVDSEKKKGMVAEVFHSVADKYDMMNDAMSLGIHRLWKDEFVRVLSPQPGTKLLDVAGGTGDIAFRFLEAVKDNPRFVAGASPNGPAHVTVLDINASMLQVGKDRAHKKGYDTWEDPSISWLEGDAEDLLSSGVKDESMDAYTIAFGLRNCTHIDKVLKEAHRVLKKGGRFLCLEFSHIEGLGLPTPLVQSLYDLYSFTVIPQLGEVLAGDRASYQYLVESIRRFPTQQKLMFMMQEAGFQYVSYKNLSLGIVAIHSGFKL